LSGTAFAQEKHVIYVPGIENNLENPKNNWYDKSQGKNGLRTPISLFQELGFKPHRTEFSTLQYTDYEDISNEIADNADPAKNRKWIIIGHSLGGLRARIAHDEMFNKLGEKKFKGIVTFWSYSYHKRGEEKWNKTLRALRNVDNMWNKVIGENIKIAKSYRFQEWQSCDGRARYCYDCNGPAQVKQLESLFAMEGCSDPKKLDQGGVWVWKTRRYYVWVADKSDAFIPQKRTKWSPGQSIVKANPDGSIPDGAINVTYDGSEDPYKDGGYNHLEIINLYRTYGDKKESWPMWGAAWWMEEQFGK
jgi:hypothetical protein